jgi:hypothetical protein
MRNKHNRRLVLECVLLAAEVIRLAQQILALVGTAINYTDEPQMVDQVRA